MDEQLKIGIEVDGSELEQGRRDVNSFADAVDAAASQSRRAASGQDDLDAALSGVGAEARDAARGLEDASEAAREIDRASSDAEGGVSGLSGILGGKLQDALDGVSVGIGNFRVDAGSLADGLGSLASKGVSGLAGGLTGLTGSLGGISGGFATLVGAINPVTAAIGAAALALTGFVAAASVGVQGAAQVAQAQGQLQAEFGVTADRARELSGVGREVFEQNWFESVDAAINATGRLDAAVEGLSDGQLSTLAQQAAAFDQVFGVAVEESAATVGVLTRNFEDLEAVEVFDLLTVAQQKTGREAGELLDIYTEYGPQFAQLGFSAEDFTQTLISGLDAGALNGDKVGDTIKEFGIRLREGTDATRDGLALLDEDLADLPDRFLAGEVSGKEAFDIVAQAMRDFEGEIPGQVLADVFGGPGEDLTAGVIAQLSTAGDALGNIEGSALAAGDAVNANLSSALAGLKRTATGVLIDVFGPFLEEARGPAIQAVQDLTERFAAFRDTATFDLLVAGAGNLGRVIGFVLGLVGDLIDLFSLAGGTLNAFSSITLKVGAAFGLIDEQAASAEEGTRGLATAAQEAAAATERTGSGRGFSSLTGDLEAGSTAAGELRRGLEDVAGVELEDVEVQVSADLDLDDLGDAAETAAGGLEDLDSAIQASAESRSEAVRSSLDEEAQARLAARDAALEATGEVLSSDEEIGASAGQRADAQDESVGRAEGIFARLREVAVSTVTSMVSANTDASSSAEETADSIEASGERVGGSYTTAAGSIRASSTDIQAAFAEASSGVSGGQRGIIDAIESTSPAIRSQADALEGLVGASEDYRSARVGAEEDAAAAASSGASEAENALGGVQSGLGETQEATEEYAEALGEIPEVVETELIFQGAEAAVSLLEQVSEDIAAIAKTHSFTIEGSYEGKDPSTQPDESLHLQHEIEDAIAAAEDGFTLEGRSNLDGTLSRIFAGDLSIASFEQAQDALAALAGVDLSTLPGPVDDLAREMRDAAAEADRLADRLSAFDGFASVFDELTAGGGALDQLQPLFAAGGFEVDLGELGFEFASFDDFLARLDELRDEPEAQLQLWQDVIGAIGDDWQRTIDATIAGLEDQRATAEAAGDAGRVAELDAELERLAGVQDNVRDILERSGDAVDRQADAYGRMADAAELAAEAHEAALEAAIQAEREIAKLAEDALDRELEAFEDQLDREKEILEARKEAIEEQRDAARQAHEERLEQLDEEEAALLSTLAPFDEEIAQIEAELNRLRLEELERKAAEAAEAAGSAAAGGVGLVIEQVTALQALLNKIENETLERSRTDVFGRLINTEAERASIQDALDSGALQELIDSGVLDKRSQRIAEIVAGGGRVRPEQLQAILQALTEAEGDQLSPEEAAIQGDEDRLALIRARRAVAQDAIQEELDGIKDRREAEEDAFDEVASGFAARLDAIDTEADALKDLADAQREAVENVRDAQRTAHEDRIAQIQAEFAAEQAAAGKSQQEIEEALAEQDRLRQEIADAAAKRLAEERRRIDEARAQFLRDRQALREAARQAENAKNQSAGNVSPPPPPPANTDPTKPDPGGDDGIDPPSPPPTAPSSTFGGVAEALAGAVTDGAAEGAAGLEDLLNPALDSAVEKARLLREILADIPGLDQIAGETSITHQEISNQFGDVFLEDELAQEIGLIDAGRSGAQ